LFGKRIDDDMRLVDRNSLAQNWEQVAYLDYDKDVGLTAAKYL